MFRSPTKNAPPPSVESMPVWAREAEARILANKPAPTDRYLVDPARIMMDAGLTPDPWQSRILRSHWKRALLLCSRQSGKSQVAAAVALYEALTRPRSLVLLLSPTLRQSGELFRDKLLALWRALGRPLIDRPPTQLSLELSNGSRIISLPESEGGIRGYSGVRLLVIDEAARVSDDLVRAVKPMLAVSNGRLLAMSTPFGKRGWLYEAWISSQEWERVMISADQCPRVPKDFLDQERAEIGPRWYAQEYGENGVLEFVDVIGSVFRQQDIDAALTATIKPLFLS
jgi:terminase large subunit-like protein